MAGQLSKKIAQALHPFGEKKAMLNRRAFLAAGAALVSSPTISRAQAATKKLRIVVVANRNHEADGLMAALSNQMKQSPNLSYPYKVASPQTPTYPPAPQDGSSPRCLIDVKNAPLDKEASATMEIWCIDDIVKANGDSKKKADALDKITNYTTPSSVPDGVIAFGTAGYPGPLSNDGGATIGGTIFIHDASNDVPGTPGGTWAWPQKMGVLVPSKAPASFFATIASDQSMLNAIALEMIAPQIHPAGVLQLLIAADAVGISSVNIPYVPGGGAGAVYCGIDTKAIDLARAKGAVNITSVETTHGVIRSKWEDAPFIYVTAIPNRVCHFPDEASGVYAQEFPSSHNAGIALKYVIPSFVKATAT